MTQTPYVIPFIAGILAFVSPCIIPMITVYLSLITGLTTEELLSSENKAKVKAKLFGNTIFFVIGFAVVFTLAGGAAGYIGKYILAWSRWLNVVGGVFVVVLGLSLAGLFRTPVFRRLDLGRRLKVKPGSLGYPGSLLVGAFFAVACSHCIGPMLYSVLLYAGSTGTAVGGMGTLAAFSLGLAIPYLIVAAALGESLEYLGKIKKYQKAIGAVAGLLLVALGALMIADKFTLLAQLFGRLLPYKLPLGM